MCNTIIIEGKFFKTEGTTTNSLLISRLMYLHRDIDHNNLNEGVVPTSRAKSKIINFFVAVASG